MMNIFENLLLTDSDWLKIHNYLMKQMFHSKNIMVEGIQYI